MRWAIQLHTGSIECDATYGRGNFYKHGIEQPKFKFDIRPAKHGVVQADARTLPLPDTSVHCVALDPPFMARTGPGASLKELFGEVVGTIEDLWDVYSDMMKEAYRILQPGGWLIVKCQDGVLSGRNNFTHVEVYNRSKEIGFIPVDLFILLAKHRMMHPRHKRQIHARKFHSYFWILKKEE